MGNGRQIKIGRDNNGIINQGDNTGANQQQNSVHKPPHHQEKPKGKLSHLQGWLIAIGSITIATMAILTFFLKK